MSLRKVVFWLHLASGIVAGTVIWIMSFTGVVLAFEKQIIAWVDRESAIVAVPPGAQRLPVDELIRRARAAHPELAPATAIVKSDPAAAVTLTLGTTPVHANPYTGEIVPQGAAKTRAFMRSMVAWHRYIALAGDQRPMGKAITGACNFAFFFLAASGLYLWMPRKWSWSALRPSVWFNGSRGKARDWNWHNVIGFWSAPVLIVLTLTALPISYAWVTNLLNRLNPPAAAAAAPAPPAAAAAAGPRRDFDALLLAAQREVPRWSQITMRLDGGTGARAAAPAAAGAMAPGPGPAAAPRGPQPVSFTIRESNTWPRTANTTLTLDPFTADRVSRIGYAELAPAARVRAWTRFLHTGEALGPGGQLVAGLASLGGCFLVWTGFALTWRRFFGRPPASASAPASAPAREAAVRA